MSDRRPQSARRPRRLSGDTRGVSVTVGYILTLAVAALLLGVLVTGASGLLAGQSEIVVGDELNVVGNQLAANIDEADQLARIARDDATASGTDGRVVLDVRLPDRVSGSEYDVEIDDASRTITLEALNPEVTVEVAYPDTEMELEGPDRFRGGSIRLVYDGGDTLEVQT